MGCLQMLDLLAIFLGTVLGQWLYPSVKQAFLRIRGMHKYHWQCPIPRCSFKVSGTNRNDVDTITENHIQFYCKYNKGFGI